MTPCSSNSNSGIYPKELKVVDLSRYLYTNVLSNFIHNSQKLGKPKSPSKVNG